MSTTHYSITYSSTTDKPWAAQINCYGQPHGEGGGPRLAAIRFFASGRSVPASGMQGNVPVINFSMARFDQVVGMLRSETGIDVNRFMGGPDNETSLGLMSFSAAGGLRDK